MTPIKIISISCLVLASLSILYFTCKSNQTKTTTSKDLISKQNLKFFNLNNLSQQDIYDLQQTILEYFTFFDLRTCSVFLISLIYSTKTTEKDIYDLKDLFCSNYTIENELVFEMIIFLKSNIFILTDDRLKHLLQTFFYYFMIEEDKKCNLIRELNIRKEIFERIQKKSISIDFNQTVFKMEFKDGLPMFNFFYILFLRFAFDNSVKKLNNIY